ncbi:hypothetical protein KAU19_03230 [Candidatus Parcubacteria bacterium]|nr:hypothetical protein [Candidatus Parcubacteria bacterium]
MNNIKSKLILLSVSVFCIPAIVSASQLFPPEIPVLFYGSANINDKPADVNTVISVKTKIENIEIASSSVKDIGRYFIEVPCQNYIGQEILFNVSNLTGGQHECPNIQTMPSIKLDLATDITNITINQWTTEVVIPAIISDDTEVKLNFISVSADNKKIATIGNQGLVFIRNSSLAENRFEVNFSANTVISGDSGWGGTIIMPTLKNNYSVSIPAEEGETNNITEIIEIGFSKNILSLDKPASILFPKMSGKKIGYSYNESDFTEIVNTCPLNNGDSLVGDKIDCKFDDGIDLIVWTKHFTNFVVYSQIVDSGSEAAGNAGNPIILMPTSCAKVIYDEWQKACVNNWQYRNIISKVPNNCSMTAEQQAQAKRECGLAEDDKKIKVLSAEFYSDSSLIRGSDMKIYLIENQTKRHIINLKALKQFIGMKIFNVTDKIINLYLAGDKIFANYGNGDLIRGSDMKVYIIKNNKKHHIINLTGLRKYTGQKIYNISDDALAQY